MREGQAKEAIVAVNPGLLQGDASGAGRAHCRGALGRADQPLDQFECSYSTQRKSEGETSGAITFFPLQQPETRLRHAIDIAVLSLRQACSLVRKLTPALV